MANALTLSNDQSPFIGVKQQMNTGVKYQLVEMVIPINQTTYNSKFVDQTFLRLKQIISVEIFTILDMGVSATNTVLLSGAQLNSCYLTFYGTDPDTPGNIGYFVEEVPAMSLHRMVNGTDPYVFQLETWVPRNIVWDKTSATFYGSIGNTANAVSLLLRVGYLGTLES